MALFGVVYRFMPNESMVFLSNFFESCVKFWNWTENGFFKVQNQQQIWKVTSTWLSFATIKSPPVKMKGFLRKK